MKISSVILFSLLLVSCAGVPESIKPVTDFDINKYMGKWYEIARLDHRFERGLEKVTATYSLNRDGSVRVENRGFSTENKEWEDAVGKARFAGGKNTGHLKVSFFGPFYGSYVIFDLDKEDYQYSFVTGSENTLWFLSRTPEVSDELKNKFLSIVKDAGYNTEGLIFVNQK
ncbi:MAG: lipocalin family protein [Gammaproteobacteria bacterium]|nr:lipocalin family protein [Gammaproteobacteria bacterium]